MFAPVANLVVKEMLPVMIFIHGGSFDCGDKGGADLKLYDGSNLARQNNIIVVSTNYRLGVFGFLSLPEELGTPIRGNFGLMDQRAAMLWVQRNATGSIRAPLDI